MQLNTPLHEQLDTIESAGFLLLDVVDMLRQEATNEPAERALQNGLRAKIKKQLRHQEKHGDPLQIVEMMQELLEEGRSTNR